MAKVAIVMGSDSDLPVMSKAADFLEEIGIDYEMTIISAHREPDIFFEWAKGAEERGQGQAIANNLYELTDVKTPIISVMIGEGGSGGALALAVADEVWMLENAYYSVITPESCASILFKDPKRAPEAAEHLKLTASDLNKMGIVEKVVEEPEDFSEEKETSHFMKKLADDLSKEIKQLEKKPVDKLLDDRYEKYRKIGRYSEYSEAVGEVPGAAQLLGASKAPVRKRRGLFGRG